jgi:hypothetical protein
MSNDDDGASSFLLQSSGDKDVNSVYRPISDGLYRFTMLLPPETNSQGAAVDPSARYYMADVYHDGIQVYAQETTVGSQLSDRGFNIEYRHPVNNYSSFSIGANVFSTGVAPFILGQYRAEVGPMSVAKYQIGLTDEDPLINVSTTKLSDSENFETSWMIGSFPQYGKTGAEIGVRWFDFFRSNDIYSGIQHIDGTTSVRLKFEVPTSSGGSYVGLLANNGDGSVAAIWGISISSLLASTTGLASFSTGSIQVPTSLKGLRRTELASYWRRDFFKD